MARLFILEFICGLTSLIITLLFGKVGMVVLVLIAAQPFITKKKWDEREKQLFYRVGNYTAGALIVSGTIIYECSKVSLNGHLIGSNWLILLGASLVFSHGAAGLIIFRKY